MRGSQISTFNFETSPNDSEYDVEDNSTLLNDILISIVDCEHYKFLRFRLFYVDHH